MQDNEEVDTFIQEALTKIQDGSLMADDLVALTLETGKFGVAGMLYWIGRIPRRTATPR